MPICAFQQLNSSLRLTCSESLPKPSIALCRSPIQASGDILVLAIHLPPSISTVNQ